MRTVLPFPFEERFAMSRTIHSHRAYGSLWCDVCIYVTVRYSHGILVSESTGRTLMRYDRDAIDRKGGLGGCQSTDHL